MSEDKNTQPEESGQGIFEDLLREAPISSLQFEEPEYDAFDVRSVIEEAKSEVHKTTKNRVFGKRVRKPRPTEELSSAPVQPAQKMEEEADHPAVAEGPLARPASPSFMELVNSEKQSASRQAPKTFRELLHSDLIGREEIEFEEPLTASLMIETPVIEEPVEITEKSPVITTPEPEEASPIQVEQAEDIIVTLPAQKEEEEEDAVLDPSASLVDDYNYDEYEDHKRFLLSDYKKVEDYLASQSRQGYHFVRREGKKFYFIKGKPHDYYYKVLYYAKEPSKEQFEQWREDGWKRINQAPSRHKRDAGWYILRNEAKEGELLKDIDNEAEKYRYFTRFSSSCRSTMFLLFIVMLCCALTIWLQIQFHGYMAVIAASGVLFLVALWTFLMYARLLSQSRKQASLLSARIRLADHDPAYHALRHETDDQLDADWDRIELDDDEEADHH